MVVVNELYSRQESLRLKRLAEVNIIGAGGTGANTAILLAMSGVDKVRVWDADTLSESNRARLPYPPNWVGRPKVDCLKEYIQWLRPQTIVETHQREFDLAIDIGYLSGGEVIVEACDNPQIRDVLFAMVPRRSVLCVHYDGRQVEVYWLTNFRNDFGYEETPGRNGYNIIPSWVCPAVFASCKAVDILMGKGISVMGDMARPESILARRAGNE